MQPWPCNVNDSLRVSLRENTFFCNMKQTPKIAFSEKLRLISLMVTEIQGFFKICGHYEIAAENGS